MLAHLRAGCENLRQGDVPVAIRTGTDLDASPCKTPKGRWHPRHEAQGRMGPEAVPGDWRLAKVSRPGQRVASQSRRKATTAAAFEDLEEE